MYGTVYRMQPKPGKEQEVIQLLKEWELERAPNVKGAKAGYLYKLDNGGMMGVALFDSKEAYQANAADPEQDKFYRRWRDLLEADPEWNDGEVVNSWQA